MALKDTFRPLDLTLCLTLGLNLDLTLGLTPKTTNTLSSMSERFIRIRKVDTE